MTRDKLCKLRFKAYMIIDFKHPKIPQPVECMLEAINFDTEIMMLRPLKENPFDQDAFPAHISHCEISRPKLKINL